MQKWVANDYPGTKTGIDEYNFGGLESINGAVVQADILGIFGRQGLDMGAFWPTTNYSQQGPGNYAFAMYRNYDGKRLHIRRHVSLRDERGIRRRRRGPAGGLWRAAKLRQCHHGDGDQQDLRPADLDDQPGELHSGGRHDGAGLPIQQRQSDCDCPAGRRERDAAVRKRDDEHDQQLHFPAQSITLFVVPD